ncbi:liver-expressed antimicrobial peptide 2 [Scleropages formosus]|uniref:Liver-expressed antimicrobial peptide 2 n=1 Tax=Scleropages formosus TaxID=113540 RepID=A0A8C9RJP0_SCLFO|nr:liver-expressed antimicrobial peptide 2-like [Scleropages formosus]
MTAFTWSLLLLVLVHQVSTDPVVQEEDQPVAPLREGLLRRIARMTPLWRIMGSKPHGAYCQDNYECSTGICRGGHCSFSQPIKS